MATSPVFSSSGLASGIDTASIVDALVKLEQAPITALQKQQTALQTQVSTLGDIMSKLSALSAASQALGSSGVVQAATTSSNTSFTATPGSNAQAGSYNVRVDQLAQAAKWRSTGFATPTTGVLGGTLTLTVQGTALAPITIADGATLGDVAAAIRASGAPISATVLTGYDPVAGATRSYLSLTARDTGFPVTGAPGDALSFAFTPAPGGTGQDAGFGNPAQMVQAAQNAKLNVDGLDFVRQGNAVNDAIPGVTLNLKVGATAPATTGTTEVLSLQTDNAATQTKLQTFVDAYNAVMQVVQAQLNVTKDTDRSTSLVGDSAVRALQSKLQSIVTTRVPGLANVQTLAEFGVKTGKDGSLSIDATAFGDGMSRDPAALDTIFSATGTGLADVVFNAVQLQTRSGDGVLSVDQQSLTKRISDMGDQAAQMQLRIDAYRQGLLDQFTAMESIVSSLKSTGNFLTAQSAKTTG